MGITLQLALDSLTTSGIYAIIAMGVYLAYSGTRVLHLAIGEVAVAGAVVAAVVAESRPLAIAIPLGLALAGVASGLAERLLVAPLGRRVETAAILLIAGAVVLRELLRGLFTRPAYAFPSLGGRIVAAGTTIRAADILTLIIAGTVVAVITVGLRRTLAGAALRATAAAPDSAEMIGVNTARVRTTAFAAGGMLAAAAVMLAAARLPLAATAGAPLALKGVAAAAAGRLRSPLTVCAGALVVGSVEVVASFYLGSGGEVVSDLVAVVLLVSGLRR